MVTVKFRPSGPTQLLKVRLLIEPRFDPLIPWPLLSVAVEFEDEQVSTLPVLVSFSVVVPALALIAPPGLMEKVIATAAAMPALAPTAAAVATPVNRTLRVSLLRIAIRPSFLDRFT